MHPWAGNYTKWSVIMFSWLHLGEVAFELHSWAVISDKLLLEITYILIVFVVERYHCLCCYMLVSHAPLLMYLSWIVQASIVSYKSLSFPSTCIDTYTCCKNTFTLSYNFYLSLSLNLVTWPFFRWGLSTVGIPFINSKASILLSILQPFINSKSSIFLSIH